MKRVLGIILAVLFGVAICGGAFAVVFLAAQTKGLELWLSVLLGFTPIIGTATLLGITFLIVNLIYSED